METKRKCPTCGKRLNSSDRAEKVGTPFCSDRCRKIDLGDWLTEAYRVPEETRGPDSDEVSS